MYNARGIEITQIDADNEFACVREELRPLFLNIVAANEHVGSVERSVRTVKDDTRTLIHSLPYRKYPKELTIGAVIPAIQKRNKLPTPNVISSTMSPSTLVTGEQPLDYNTLSQLSFGTYTQVREPTQNDMAPRTQPAIAMYLSGNTGGGWIFMSLVTGRVIHRYAYTPLPITADIIQKVDDLAI